MPRNDGNKKQTEDKELQKLKIQKEEKINFKPVFAKQFDDHKKKKGVKPNNNNKRKAYN